MLLTLAVPETAATESKQSLLSNPEAIWTVLMVNGPHPIARNFRGEPSEYLTPLAQFIRGTCYAVTAQKIHIDDVIQAIKIRVNDLVGFSSFL